MEPFLFRGLSWCKSNRHFPAFPIWGYSYLILGWEKPNSDSLSVDSPDVVWRLSEVGQRQIWRIRLHSDPQQSCMEARHCTLQQVSPSGVIWSAVCRNETSGSPHPGIVIFLKAYPKNLAMICGARNSEVLVRSWFERVWQKANHRNPQRQSKYFSTFGQDSLWFTQEKVNQRESCPGESGMGGRCGRIAQ